MPESPVQGWSGKIVAVEDDGTQRLYITLDSVAALARADPTTLATVVTGLDSAFKTWTERQMRVFVPKPTSEA